jgi:hypothetical protein
MGNVTLPQGYHGGNGFLNIVHKMQGTVLVWLEVVLSVREQLS